MKEIRMAKVAGDWSASVDGKVATVRYTPEKPTAGMKFVESKGKVSELDSWLPRMMKKNGIPGDPAQVLEAIRKKAAK